MSNFRFLMLALVLSGCVPQVDGKLTPVTQSESVWDVLADRVKAGKVETTSEGLLILRELVRSGDLSKEEAAKVDQLGWEADRKLTEADETKLRGL